MRFDSAYDIENLCYSLRWSDRGRGANRAAVNRLFNGWAPFTESEVVDNDISVNFNTLTGTRKAHDARGQMFQAICKPGNYFKATATFGPKHNRSKYSEIVTRNVNAVMKKSVKYYELQRAKIAQSILHGIGIGSWADKDHWCPRSTSIEDVLIPSGEPSELPMDNLPLFAVHRSFTAQQLIKFIRGPNVDKGWNIPMVKACIKWVDEESKNLFGRNWPELWSHEKYEERIKEGDCYGWDNTPTVDVYDFYYYDSAPKVSGWKRRMILDAWGTPALDAKTPESVRRKGIYSSEAKAVKNQFLYNGGERIFACNKSELISFQFADLSAVAPFRYHTVRGLGFLLHDALHINNRLVCKVTEATFETLTALMVINSEDDVQRALKANLFNRGFIDKTVKFLGQNERWNPNQNLVQLGLELNEQLINDSSSTHSQNQDMSKGVEKGQLQIMAELNATTAMLSAGLQQYYQYQEFEYREVFRRFMNPSPACRDMEINAVRSKCMAEGVPKTMMENPEGWGIEPERIMGAGNKTLEMAISQQLLAMRNLYDPDAQREILRDVTLAVTDDSARAMQLVPEEPRVSDTVHDTELVFAALMAGRSVTPKPGLNAVEVAGTIIKEMGMAVQQIMQSGGVGTPQDIKGLIASAGYAAHFIQTLEEDKNEAKTVQKLNSVLGKIGNQVKAMAQRQAEMAKKAQAQNGNGQIPPEKLGKIQGDMLIAKTKAKIMSDTHAQRTAERTISFQTKLKEQQAKHQLDVHKSVLEHGAELHKKDLEGAANVRRGGLKSFQGDEEA